MKVEDFVQQDSELLAEAQGLYEKVEALYSDIFRLPKGQSVDWFNVLAQTGILSVDNLSELLMHSSHGVGLRVTVNVEKIDKCIDACVAYALATLTQKAEAEVALPE